MRVYVHTHYTIIPHHSRSDRITVMEVSDVRGQRTAVVLHTALSLPGRLEA